MKIAVVVDRGGTEQADVQRYAHPGVTVLKQGQAMAGMQFDLIVDLSKNRAPNIEVWFDALRTRLTAGGRLARPEMEWQA